MPLRAAALLLILGLCPCSVAAQADSTHARREEAQMLFGAGMTAYEAERYDDALDHFRRSYALVPDRAILFNMARSAERAGRAADALGYYRQLATSATEPAEQAELEAAIARMEPLAEAQAQTEASRDGGGTTAEGTSDDGTLDRGAAAHLDPAPPDEPSPAGWVLVAAGGAVAIAGAVLLALGVSDAGAINDLPPGTTRWEDVVGDVERAHGLQIGGGVGVGLGLGLVGAGAGVLAGGGRGEVTARLRLGGSF